MNKLAILSRDAKQYKTLIQQAKLGDLHIQYVSNKSTDLADFSEIDILFGDPDLTAQIIKKCTQLTWLQSTWAGNAPLFSVDKTDYQLCGVKGIFQQAMQEYVFGYLLYFARNIQGFKQAQQKQQWGAPGFTNLAGKTIGIMGVGDIGQGIAHTAKHFAMHTKGYTRTQQNCPNIDNYYAPGQEQAFAENCDYLVCLLPQSPATTGLIEQQFLAYLPKHAVLINAGRGSCIDDDALLNALKNQQLKAAVLDVFKHEPLPSEHPFWLLDNLYITHHSAAISQPEQICPLFINNYRRYVQGLPLENQLNFAKGY